jgi:hypothetical protein
MLAKITRPEHIIKVLERLKALSIKVLERLQAHK